MVGGHALSYKGGMFLTYSPSSSASSPEPQARHAASKGEAAVLAGAFSFPTDGGDAVMLLNPDSVVSKSRTVAGVADDMGGRQKSGHEDDAAGAFSDSRVRRVDEPAAASGGRVFQKRERDS